jgi:hypothetical protein
MNDEKKTVLEVRISLISGHLPLQNLLLAAAVIAAVNGLAQWGNAQTGFPFGRGHFVGEVAAGETVGWGVGLVLAAVVAVLSARGVAKLLLLPRRSSKHYGYWLLALSAALGALPLVGLDLLATRVAHCWRWESTAWHWQGIALPNLGGWLLANVIALLLATPALIDKRPTPPPPGLRLLVVWFALNGVALAGCLSRASDAAVAVLAAPVLVVTMLAFQRHRRAVADCSAPPSRE